MEKSKIGKKVIIAIVVIVVIIAIIGIGAYLYLTTDLLKGNRELFFKYISKNGEAIEMVMKDEQKELKERIIRR